MEKLCKTLGLKPSFGFGDRIGLATPGHIASMAGFKDKLYPIFPQQSIREMARTSRSADAVMKEAMDAVKDSGWDTIVGADADHLKTYADVDLMVAAGFTFYTVDPSDHVDPQADGYDLQTLKEKFTLISSAVTWFDNYLNKTVQLNNGLTIEFTEEVCLRTAVKYGAAINHAIDIGKYIEKTSNDAEQGFEIELSVDETEEPTTYAEHYIFAQQCINAGVKLISLAPRFIGEFEKGIDYKGNVQELEISLEAHAAIASALGPYKISLHSGSDKLSIYGALARATKGCFHVKTAGTSYLEALRVVVRHDPNAFRKIVAFSREHYEADKATYHVSATLADAPTVDAASDLELEREYLELWSEVNPGKGFTKLGRQILHCTFGSVLCDPELGSIVRSALEKHPETYKEILEEHFIKHLEALNSGL